MCRGQGYDGAGNMAGYCSGAAKVISTKFANAVYFHCSSHKLNLCVANSCKLRSIENMMGIITALANFFNYSPNNKSSWKNMLVIILKLIPSCKTRWVERINSLKVTLDLMKAVTEALMEVHENADKSWNRDTSTQGYSLYFEFIVTLAVTQRVLAFASGITTGLQTRGIYLVNVVEQVKFAIRALQAARDKIESFHNECFQYACD